MNIIDKLVNRIEEYRATNSKPCKSYATEAAANKAAAKVAASGATYFGVSSVDYIVFYNPHWDRWCAAFDMQKIISQGNGGYVGYFSAKDFFSY